MGILWEHFGRHFGVILRSLFGLVSTFSTEKSISGVVFARFPDILFQSRFLSRFLGDFGTPNEGKPRQNHWRVVRNQGFPLFWKTWIWSDFWLHFCVILGAFGPLWELRGRFFEKKGGRRRHRKYHRFWIEKKTKKFKRSGPRRQGAGRSRERRSVIFRANPNTVFWFKVRFCFKTNIYSFF